MMRLKSCTSLNCEGSYQIYFSTSGFVFVCAILFTVAYATCTVQCLITECGCGIVRSGLCWF